MRLPRTVVIILFCVVAATAMRGASLVADYRFENGANLGLDSSGRGNDGTIVGTVTQVAGRNAGTMAAHFDGSSKIEVLSGLGGYTGQPGFTFAAWVKLDAAPSAYDGIVSQDTGSCCVNRLLLTPTDHQPFINVGAHVDRILGSPLPTGTWFHLVLVGEDVGANREGRVYVNGVEVAGSPQSFTGNLPDGSSLDTWIGTGETGNIYYLRGALDDVQIYQGALSASEVNRLYTTGTTEPPVPALGSLALIAMALALALAGFVVLRR